MAQVYDTLAEVPPFGGMKPGPRPSVRKEHEHLATLQFERIAI